MMTQKNAMKRIENKIDLMNEEIIPKLKKKIDQNEKNVNDIIEDVKEIKAKNDEIEDCTDEMNVILKEKTERIQKLESEQNFR